MDELVEAKLAAMAKRMGLAFRSHGMAFVLEAPSTIDGKAVRCEVIILPMASEHVIVDCQFFGAVGDMFRTYRDELNSRLV